MSSLRDKLHLARNVFWAQLAALFTSACLGSQVGNVTGSDIAQEAPVSTTAAPVSTITQAADTGAPDGNIKLPQDSNSDSAPPAVFNCDEANYPVCDGFETVAVGSPPNRLRWDSRVTIPSLGDGGVHNDHPADNHIEVSDKFAHTGTQSLHLHSSPGWAHLPIEAITTAAYPKAFLPAPNGSFYVRLWLYNDGHAGDHGVSIASGHWYVVNASGPLNGSQQYQKFGGGGATLGWNYFGDDSGLGSNVPLPTGNWVCLETHFKGDTNELFVWHNDQAIDSLHSSRWAAPNYDRLTVGWEMDHPAGDYPGVDIYIDDVAFSYSRIGCTVTPP